MSFSFYNHTEQKVSSPLRTELISIGCEAWIDVSRFCCTEKSCSNSAGTHRISEGHIRSTSSHNSLTKSFADLRRKFRRGSQESLD